MAVVTFSRQVEFDIAGVRQLLMQHVPIFKWQCGEDDTGGPQQAGIFSKTELVVGRSAGDMLFVELRPQGGTVSTPAPPHAWHLEIREPTTENARLAMRVQLAIAAAVMLGDEAQARCQLRPGGNWLNAADAVRALGHLDQNGDVRDIDGLGVPAADFGAGAAPGSATAGVPLAGNLRPGDRAPLPSESYQVAELRQSFATILNDMGATDLADMCGFAKPPPFADERPREDRLPTMVLLLNDLKLIEWDTFAEAFNIIDKGGDWSFDGKLDGSATLTGRGGSITLELVSAPIPDYLLDQAFARSFWVPEGEPRRRARDHTAQLVMRCDLDTRAVPYEDVRQTAKVATLLLGLVAKHADVAALYNAGIGTIMDGEMVVKLTGILHDDEIPIQMWTWAAPDSLQADAVSLSTGGFLPFLGYEVEVWNAPGDRDFVLGQVNQALRYLLISGPVVKHGDVMGEQAGDRSIRCFFGDSKAQRGNPVRALFLELRGPDAGKPRPEVEAGGAGRAAPATLVSVVALTKPVAFAAGSLREMLDKNFPGFQWTLGGDAARGLQVPQSVTGDDGARRVAILIDARVASLPSVIPAPPHRVHVRVSVDTGGDLVLARAVALVVCACVVISQDEAAHFQLSIDGNWLSHDDALTAVIVPGNCPDIGDFDRVIGRPAAEFVGRDSRLPDGAPPSDDGFESVYGAVVCPLQRQTGGKLRTALAGGRPAQDQAPPARRAGGFGRKGL